MYTIERFQMQVLMHVECLYGLWCVWVATTKPAPKPTLTYNGHAATSARRCRLIYHCFGLIAVRQ